MTFDKFHCPGSQAFCGCGSFPSRSRALLCSLLCSLLCLLAVLPAEPLLLPVAGKGIFRQLRVLLCGGVKMVVRRVFGIAGLGLAYHFFQTATK